MRSILRPVCRRLTVGLSFVVGMAACAIDRHGLHEPSSEDAGPAGECPAGFVDADGDLDNGCEYECAPTSPPLEVCDGLDNDCDPETADGADDPGIGAACDGSDEDLCEEGSTVCVGGRTVCDDPTDSTHEVCNGVDDDCDGDVDEDALDAVQRYLDRDADGWGGEVATSMDCGAPPDGESDVPGDCDDLDPDVNPGAGETCNGVDDDCNGTIDDAPGGCDCIGEARGSAVYSFCRTHRSWTDARDDCGGRSAHLVTVDDMAEHDWLVERAVHYEDTPWWIGFNDRGSEGDWEWVDGSPVTFTAWHDGEPNDGDWLSSENCATMCTFSDRTWNDTACHDTRPYVCEKLVP